MVPEASAPTASDPGLRPRERRGALVPLSAEPVTRTRAKRGVHRFEPPRKLDPGRYVVLVRVTDRTEVRGDDLPWVLRDPDGLLTSERRWSFEVR